MLNTYKKYLVMILFVLLSLGITHGVVFAYSEQITLDAIEDSGHNPKEGAYVRFVKDSDVNDVLLNVPQSQPQFTSALDVYDYTYNNKISNWLLTSAGNIWSSDTSVGESLENLHAGTYRISPVSGAYMRDSFGWSDWSDYYWWELHIRVQDASGVNDYVLGFDEPKGSAYLALQAVLGSYLDISVSEGGSLNFWIWDRNDNLKYGNSTDNFGSITFNVASVPEPSTILLLSLGLAFLMRRIGN
jgi:hypothetical protein